MQWRTSEPAIHIRRISLSACNIAISGGHKFACAVYWAHYDSQSLVKLDLDIFTLKYAHTFQRSKRCSRYSNYFCSDTLNTINETC